jgi:hypothetical protein
MRSRLTMMGWQAVAAFRSGHKLKIKRGLDETCVTIPNMLNPNFERMYLLARVCW